MPYEGRGRTSLGINFGTSAFVIRNKKIQGYLAQYYCLRFFEIDEEGIPCMFPVVNEKSSITKSEAFKTIPGSPIAYWASESVREIFKEAKPLGEIAEPRQGLATADNNRFLRLWHEVSMDKIGFGFENRSSAADSGLKWFPYNKGGDFRKWYGNNEYVVNWKNDGYEIRNFKQSVVRNHNYYFLKGITWSLISSSYFGVRCFPKGMMFDVGSHSLFCDENDYNYYAGYLNSIVANRFLFMLNPTLNFSSGVIAKLPIIMEKGNFNDSIVEQNINISKTDWDSFETSWDFQRHPLLSQSATTLQEAFAKWTEFTDNQFNQLKANEEELNRLFIEIYGLQDEMTPEVEDKDITIRKADLSREIRSFISYAVGCMLGRYSLDEPGLAFAGGEFEPAKYQTFPVDRDGILPILADEYFADDIVTRFINFVKVTFGDKTLNENLEFIATALGKTGNETAIERIRKYFLNDFYKDHLQTYKNRPIYWLFTSGKEKAFNVLIYLHRYDKSTIARIRTDYLHELQGKLEIEARRLEKLSVEGSAGEKREAAKRLNTIAKQREELRKYDELLRHFADQQIELDLDDGVKVNYGKFKGLEKEEE